MNEGWGKKEISGGRGNFKKLTPTGKDDASDAATEAAFARDKGRSSII